MAFSIRLVRGEVDQLDEGTTNVQGNVADVAGILMWQHNAWGIIVFVACRIQTNGMRPAKCRQQEDDQRQ